MAQTATNPQTGEKLVLQGGQWVPMGGQQAPARIYGNPKQPAVQTPVAAARDQVGLQRDQIGLEGDRVKLEQERLKAQKASGEGATKLRQQEAEAVLQSIKSARDNIGWSTTGLPGQVISNIGGTDAYDLRSQVETVKANLGFDKLQAMREASPTGGALGQVTERELALLQSTLANLDTAQSEEQLRTNLEKVELHYLNFLNALNGSGPAGSIDDARNSYQALAGGGEVQFRDERPSISGTRLAPEDEQAYYALIRRNPPPTPDEITQFFAQRNVGVANAGDISGALNQGAQPSTGIDYSQVDEAARAAAQAELDARPTEVGDAGTLLAQGQTLGLSDEAAGVGRGLSRLAQGRNPVEGYRLGRDAERLRIEQARGNLGAAGTALEVGGGILSANPQGAILPATSRVATVVQGARAGAIGGGVAGYGYGEGLEGSATNALLGAGLGGAIGGGLSTLGSRGGASQARMEAPDLMAAAQRQGVNLNVANVRPGARNALAYLEASPGSAGPVQRNLGNQAQRLEDRAATLGNSGTALNTNTAGQTVRNAGERFIKRSGALKDRMYEQAAKAAGDTKVAAKTAIERIRTRIADLEETPTSNRARIDALEEVLEDLVAPDGTPKPVSVEGLRNMRSGIRTSLRNKNLTMTPAETDAMEALSAISDDLAAGLAESSPQAGRLYQRADRFYRERQATINNVMKRVLGPKEGPYSGEKVFGQLQAMASPGRSGDAGRLAKLMNTLDASERADIAATIAERLGRAKPGEGFSPAHFVSQASQLSPSARRLVFGKEGAQAIDDLERISRSVRDVQRSLNNSRSGQVASYGDMLRSSISTLVGGGAGAAAGGVPGAIVGAAAGRSLEMAARRISASLLLSKSFTKWLARAPRTNDPKAIQAHIRQLGGLGRGAPIAVEMQSLQQALQRQFSPALAGEQEQKPNGR